MNTNRLLNLALKVFRADNKKNVCDGCNKTNETIMNLFRNNKSRKLTYILNIRIMKKLKFLTPNAKKVFIHFCLTFIETPIL